MNGLKLVGALIALLGASVAGELIGGMRGSVLGALAVSLIVFSGSRSNPKHILPVRPVLWDRDMDD